MKNILMGLALVVIFFPWMLKSLANGNIDLNGLLLDLVETVGETITRSDLNLSDSYEPPAQPQQQQQQQF